MSTVKKRTIKVKKPEITEDVVAVAAVPEPTIVIQEKKENEKEKKEELVIRSRVAGRDMRPMCFEDVIGKTANNLLKYIKHVDSHFIIIHGETGTGKTTIARILAMYLQGQDSYTEESFKKYQIDEHNAAVDNGIDHVRKVIDDSRYVPKYGSIVRVNIFDEAHQLSQQAQDAFLVDTEDAYKKVYYIFCTSDLRKIKKALQNRAAIFKTELLTDAELNDLLVRAKELTGCKLDIKPLLDVLKECSVYAPRNVLQAFDKYSAGIPPNECVTHSSGGYNDKELVAAILAGDFSKVAPMLPRIDRTEIYSARLYITDVIGRKLIASGTTNTLALSKAIKQLQGEYSTDSLAILYADIRMACDCIKATTTVAKQTPAAAAKTATAATAAVST